MAYEFALNINNEVGELTPKTGMPFGDLGELIKQLDTAIDTRKHGKCILYDVQNHGYTPCFTTDSKTAYEKFIEVHNNIYDRSIADLNKDEAAYANSIKKLLKNGTYLEALDTDHKTIHRIYPDEIEKTVDYYNVTKSISGVISQIGSLKLDKTSHIYLDGHNFKIFITAQQDEQLRQYYRNEDAFLDLKIIQKRSIQSGRVINARLISHKIKLNKTIHESLNELSEDDLLIINSFITE